MKRYWFAVLLVAALAAPACAESSLAHVNVFVSGQDGYSCYRIPALEVAPDGSLLAFAEARKYNAGDPGMENNEIDLVGKRSTDNGRTWSAMEVIEHAGERWSSANPATVVDRQTGRVWLLYLRCKPGRGTDTARPGTDDNQVLARWSDNNGRTWSAPLDLTAASRDMKDPKWRRHGDRAGRDDPGPQRGDWWRPPGNSPPSACWLFIAKIMAAPGIAAQPVPCPWGDENQVRGTRRRADSHGLSPGIRPASLVRRKPRRRPHLDQAAAGLPVSPVCCAIERYTLKSAGDDRDRIVWTGPRGPGRNNLVARISYDEGQTFPSRAADRGRAGGLFRPGRSERPERGRALGTRPTIAILRLLASRGNSWSRNSRCRR